MFLRIPPRSRIPAIGLLAAAVAVTTGLPAHAAVDAKPSDTPSDLHSLRAPVTDENFYFVMADRFDNGDTDNDEGGLGSDPLVSGFDPTRKGFYNGGDLAGLLRRIDYIQGLGTTSIWLTPSFTNQAVSPDGSSAGYHGYWITDFTRIDPHLGTNDELRQLIDEAHSRGMKVYFDIITNHTADIIGYEEGQYGYVSKDEAPYETADGVPFDDRDYAGSDTFPELDAEVSFPYTPVLEPGEETLKVPGWLNDVELYHNRGDTTFTGEDSEYGDFFGLDDLFTEHPTVVKGMEDIYKTWIGDFGVDGFRIDTMKHVNDEFWQEFGPDVLSYARAEGKEEFFMFGEVFDTSKSFTSQYTTRNRIQAVLDFPFQDAARTFASKSGDPRALETFFANDDWYTDADSNVYQLPTFLGNHDMGRIGSFIAADNAGATDAELVARDALAHELMYFSRGNPVIYYGDEQGFTGPGGDQDARQSMFASRVPDYLDDDLLGTDSTHAVENFDTAHPLYTKISELAELTEKYPALRDGAHQHRYAAEGSGIYAFSRIDTDKQREYVVALNNSEQPQTAAVPTYLTERNFRQVYGDGAARLTTAADATLTVTVPPLSAVVYRALGTIPNSKAAPAIQLQAPVAAPGDNGRINVRADVAGTSFYEVTFEARQPGGSWERIGTDDTAPFQVFHDVAAFDAGARLEYRATVLDNRGHTATSAGRSATVPAPLLTLQKPVEGGSTAGAVELTATSDPEKADYTVTFERSLDSGATWTVVGTDDSSPAYSVVDDVSALERGTQVQYRATVDGPGFSVASDVWTHTVGETPQPDTVTVAGSLNQAMGCEQQWQPSCPQAMLTRDPADDIWRLTVDLPAGSYEYKAAINGDWTENYGEGGVPNGSNIRLEHPGGSVTFVYDNATHVLGTAPAAP